VNLLESLGWNQSFQQCASVPTDGIVGRVIEEQRDLYQVASMRGELWASLAGRFRHEAKPGDFPAVGDWVVMRHRPGEDRATIASVVGRRSCFRRAAPQTGQMQVIAANVDVALVVAALGGDFNVRRIERYLTAVYESGAVPVVVLTKCDLHDDVQAFVDEVESVAPGVRVVATSAVREIGIDALRELIEPGRTAVIVGSSGTGKSSLVNRLMRDDVQYVSGVSGFKDKGRHTTTSRKLILLPQGGIIIDTPGMRELQFYDVDEGVSQTFEDIEQLVARCRFTDCSHESEPGCAVRRALDSGMLDAARWRSYQKLLREAAYQARQLDDHLAREEGRRWRQISIQSRKGPKRRLW
jgi:ribosome biogenesis GTPase